MKCNGARDWAKAVRMATHRRRTTALMIAAATTAIAGCSTPAQDTAAQTTAACKPTTIEAESVQLIKARKPVVRFTARVTDEDGKPVPDAEVEMALAYGTSSETASGPAAAGARTDVQGVAVADAPVRRIKLLGAPPLFPDWVAHYLPDRDLEYCESRDRGRVPDEILRLVPPR